MTAADRIFSDLQDHSWHCGVTEWARDGWMLSFAQRISLDLKAKRGLPIESRVCDMHPHRSTCHMYRLVPTPKQMELAV